MFWTRHSREARRQKVLDELLDLEPGERRGRLDAAVAAGDVHADEIDSTLLMVHRLDALRVMTIPPGGVLSGTILPVASSERVAPLEALDGGEAADADAEADAAADVSYGGTAYSARVLDAAAIPIVADPEPAWPWLDAEPLPIDAVEAASRLIAQDRAARRSARPSLRRVRAGGIRREAAGRRPRRSRHHERNSAAAGSASEENWPDTLGCGRSRLFQGVVA